MRALIASSMLMLVNSATGADLPPPEQIEQHPGIEITYGTLTRDDGVRLQTIITKPAKRSGRLPAILYVQWLSCSPVAISDNPKDGWSAMLRGIVQRSGALVWRTEKRGVGRSEGDCALLDYNTELADHRAAFDALRHRADVDPNRIVIVGGSMGGTYAPLIAANQTVAGVISWGAGATTWAERTLNFERSAMELRGVDPTALATEMRLRFAFLDRYLNQRLTPQQITAADPALGGVWPRIVGTSATAHYGRPFAFHQQAQAADWTAAWSQVKAPVLALYGEYDWFESRAGVELIARTVNQVRPGTAQFIEIPKMNHHFEIYPTREQAFEERDPKVDAEPAVRSMLEWLSQRFIPRG